MSLNVLEKAKRVANQERLFRYTFLLLCVYGSFLLLYHPETFFPYLVFSYLFVIAGLSYSKSNTSRVLLAYFFSLFIFLGELIRVSLTALVYYLLFSPIALFKALQNTEKRVMIDSPTIDFERLY